MTAPWTITVERDEILEVAHVLGQCPPVETYNMGVWVEHRGDTRYWKSASTHVMWEVTGAPVVGDLAACCLPGRLLWHAADLAQQSASGTVTISVPDGLAVLAATDAGSAVVDLPVDPEDFDLPWFIAEEAQGTTTVAALYRMLGRSRVRPIGCPEVQPPVTLAVVAGELATTVDWSEHDGFRSTYRIPAETSGTARSVIAVEALMDVLCELDSDEEVTVVFPEDSSVPLLVATDTLRAAIPRRESSILRFHDDLGQALADASGRTCHTLDRGVFSAEFADRTFHVELVATAIEVVRVATVVAYSIEPTLEVLAQLNDLNAALVCGRVWIDEVRVLAGFDLPCGAIDEIGACLAALSRQLDGLGVFLSALGEAA